MIKPRYLKMPSIPSSGNRYSTMNYSSREEIVLPDTVRTLTILKDFTIERDASKERRSYRSVLPNEETLKSIKIEEPVVLISVFNGLWGYFHLLYNILGEIEVIKHFYPDVKVKIIKYIDQNNYFTNKLNELGIFKAYNISDDDVIDMSEYESLYFKEVFSIYSEYNHALRYIYHGGFNYDTEKEGMADWGRLVASGMRKSFEVDSVEKPTRKIFISRLKDNDRLRAEAEILQKRAFGYELTVAEATMAARVKPNQLVEIVDRPMARSEEKLLEKMFKEAGYEIVDPGKLKTINDQAQLYAEASHIVGLAGAGFVNCCFSHPDAKILILNSSTSYTFPHKQIVESYNRFVEEAPPRTPWKNKVYFASGIFNYVRENHPEFFD